MGCDTYSVMIDSVVIAKGMSIGNALILVEALFIKWYEETDLKITVVKESDNAFDPGVAKKEGT